MKQESVSADNCFTDQKEEENRIEMKLKEQIRDVRFFQLPEDKNPREHSHELDVALGFEILKIEKNLIKHSKSTCNTGVGGERWIGLNPHILQTPYSEISHFLSLFKEYDLQKVVDFGAAYGRVAFVMNALYPQASFLGYEIVEERQVEAQRVLNSFDMKNCQILKQNILEESFQVPKADVYFSL